MKIFGIGWAKTGTTTLGHCLEILGHRHQGQRLDLVDDLTTGDLSRILAVAAEAEAFEDWPWILLYRELDAAFPGSRFILTVRDPQRWLKSYHNMLEQPGIVTEDLTRIRRLLYGLPFPDVTAEQLVERYQRHNDDVLNHFRSRPEALLVVDWERGDGWPQLCEFLGRPIPDVPFPHENKGCYELGGRPADGPDTTPRTPSAAAGFPALIARVLAPLLRDVEGVALVGFPHHWNIGDSVIWAGTLQVLRELGIPVRYVCTPKTYDAAELRLHLPAGPVLLTGGGNFGDVYLDEVALRRRVFEDFPDRHVIQLPQSIWFRSAGGRGCCGNSEASTWPATFSRRRRCCAPIWRSRSRACYHRPPRPRGTSWDSCGATSSRWPALLPLTAADSPTGPARSRPGATGGRRPDGKLGPRWMPGTGRRRAVASRCQRPSTPARRSPATAQ
jgi:hypothetical protein